MARRTLVLACQEAVTVADHVRAAKALAELELALERRDRDKARDASTDKARDALPAAHELRTAIEAQLAKALAEKPPVFASGKPVSTQRPRTARDRRTGEEYPVVRGLLQ